MRTMMLAAVALLATAAAASAQTAGGPQTASPGAMPADTPLTTGGKARHGATPATPAATGANKPALPLAARTPSTTAKAPKR